MAGNLGVDVFVGNCAHYSSNVSMMKFKVAARNWVDRGQEDCLSLDFSLGHTARLHLKSLYSPPKGSLKEPLWGAALWMGRLKQPGSQWPSSIPVCRVLKGYFVYGLTKFA